MFIKPWPAQTSQSKERKTVALVVSGDNIFIHKAAFAPLDNLRYLILHAGFLALWMAELILGVVLLKCLISGIKVRYF